MRTKETLAVAMFAVLLFPTGVLQAATGQLGESPSSLHIEDLRAEHDRHLWQWFRESLDTPTTVARLKEAIPHLDAADLEWTRAAMQHDANALATPGVSAYNLIASVDHQLSRKMLADAAASARPADDNEALTRVADDATVWAAFADVLAPFAHFRERNPATRAVDVLWAIRAASMNEQVMERWHRSDYNVIDDVRYHVAQKLMLDAMVSVVENCVGGAQAAACLGVRQANEKLCDSLYDLCRENPLTRISGWCSLEFRLCQCGVDCAYCWCLRGAIGNCFLDCLDGSHGCTAPTPGDPSPRSSVVGSKR